MTAPEKRDLVRVFKAIPRNPSGYTHWDSPQGAAVIAQVRALNADGVSFSHLADALGVSRQVLSLHLRGGAAAPKIAAPRALTARQADKLTEAYDAIPARPNGAIKWDSDEGLAFLRMAEKVRDGGVRPADVAAAVDMTPSVLGRLIGIQDRLAEQVRQAKAKAAARGSKSVPGKKAPARRS